MALFEKYPKDVRKIIALSITIITGAILLVVMVVIYTSKPINKNDSAKSKISDFYKTILEKGTLFFDRKML